MAKISSAIGSGIVFRAVPPIITSGVIAFYSVDLRFTFDQDAFDYS